MRTTYVAQCCAALCCVALCCVACLFLVSITEAADGPTIPNASFCNETTCAASCASKNLCYDRCGWGRRRKGPRFFATAESLFLKLDQGTRDAVPVVINQDTSETVLTTKSLDYGTEAGPRLGVGVRLNECSAIEASYFGLHHWRAGAVATGDNNLRVPGDLALATFDFFDADEMRLDYTSELHNVEVNFVHRTKYESLSVLAGFRHLSLDEAFGIHASDIDTAGSNYNIHTVNRLYGAQFGGKLEREWCRFGFELVGKAGIYGNTARQQSYVGDFDNLFTIRESTTNGSRTAFIGELGLNGTYRLTRCLHIRAGYNFLWVEGLARAMDQLDFTDTATSGTALIFGKGAFLHGANVGLEARW